jgi:predicted transcriptional regulator
MSYTLTGQFSKAPDGATYVGVVSKVEGTTLTVLTVGCEASEHDILVWIKETIKLMRDSGQTDIQAPDMLDRLNKVVN